MPHKYFVTFYDTPEHFITSQDYFDFMSKLKIQVFLSIDYPDIMSVQCTSYYLSGRWRHRSSRAVGDLATQVTLTTTRRNRSGYPLTRSALKSSQTSNVARLKRYKLRWAYKAMSVSDKWRVFKLNLKNRGKSSPPVENWTTWDAPVNTCRVWRAVCCASRIMRAVCCASRIMRRVPRTVCTAPWSSSV